MPDQVEPRPPTKRRWLRISLRGLMVLVLVAGGWLGWYINVVRVQREAVAAIRRSGGSVSYEWACMAGSTFNPWSRREPPGWVLRWFGPDAFGSVVAVHLRGKPDDDLMAQVLRLPRLQGLSGFHLNRLTDTAMVKLGDLTRLEEIDFGGIERDSPMTGAMLARFANLGRLRWLRIFGLRSQDAELAPIAGLVELERLELGMTGITDAGLIHIRGLVRLQILGLAELPLTTAGLTHLRGLMSLDALELGSTQVADIAPLAGLSKLHYLGLSQTPITDAGLAPIAGLTQLERLDLRQTAITDAGLAALARLIKLVELDLTNTAITDTALDHLDGLTGLKQLTIVGTRVTPEGAARFQQAHPTVKIQLFLPPRPSSPLIPTAPG